MVQLLQKMSLASSMFLLYRKIQVENWLRHSLSVAPKSWMFQILLNSFLSITQPLKIISLHPRKLNLRQVLSTSLSFMVSSDYRILETPATSIRQFTVSAILNPFWITFYLGYTKKNWTSKTPTAPKEMLPKVLPSCYLISGRTRVA